eukprot:10031119-Alexandrium_andersonii.AAC.1
MCRRRPGSKLWRTFSTIRRSGASSWRKCSQLAPFPCQSLWKCFRTTTAERPQWTRCCAAPFWQRSRLFCGGG